MDSGLTRTALVTGATGGIGRAIVETFSASGWHVIATDIVPAGDAPGGADYVAADLSTREGIEAVVRILQRAGRLDALINNAAVQISKPLVDTTIAEWDHTMNVNVRAPFLLTQAAFPFLRASQGSVVNVASVHAVATSTNIAAYAASKGALVALTRAMAIEFAPAQVRVNAVLPGAVDTQMLRAGLARGQSAAGDTDSRLFILAEKTVLGRIARPEEIAEAVLFLADAKRSSFVTGQVLIVDGGATARLSTE